MVHRPSLMYHYHIFAHHNKQLSKLHTNKDVIKTMLLKVKTRPQVSSRHT